MRPIFLLAPLLAACSQEAPAPTLATGEFAGEGRDRLCLAGEPGSYRAGLISYATGEVNCSASGRIEGSGANWTLFPKGEGECRIPLVIDGNSVRIGQVPASCTYYCGPGAAMAGKSFNRTDMGSKTTDLGGEPLC